MPTVILLDVSLSMCRPVPDSAEPLQVRHLAVHGINAFLDHMAQHCKLEFATLVVFSSLWEVVVPFTRDFDSIRAALARVECHDKTNLEAGLEGAKQALQDEWGHSMPCQVVLVTDGSLGVGAAWRAPPGESPLGRLHVVCLGSPQGPALPHYQRLVDAHGGGRLCLPEGPPSIRSVTQAFESLAQSLYVPFRGVLRCGQLWSCVTLCPPPEPHRRPGDFHWSTAQAGPTIQVCGFLDLVDVANPPTLSRHLVLPVPSAATAGTAPAASPAEAEEEEGANDEGKQPSFCVLLHGSLKVEGMVALCQLGWWSNRFFTFFSLHFYTFSTKWGLPTGLETVPWLGNFSRLGPLAAGEGPSLPGFPVKPSDKHSYSQNSVVWIRQSDLQADIQKILRHARKLPEKTANFYK
ncbi:conserved hypothetical protein, partial [Ixodes scapularis]